MSCLAPTLFGANLVGEDVANQFAEAVATGNGGAGDPARHLREYGIRRSLSNLKPPKVSTHLTIAKAWNKWVAGESVKMLRSRTAGESSRVLILNDVGAVVFPMPESN